MLFFLCIALAGALPLDVKALLKEREEALAEFHDARTSPLAVISRHVFDGEQPLRIGSDRSSPPATLRYRSSSATPRRERNRTRWADTSMRKRWERIATHSISTALTTRPARSPHFMIARFRQRRTFSPCRCALANATRADIRSLLRRLSA